MRNPGVLIVWALVAIAAAGCREPYNPPVIDEDVDYLVVDAFLNVQGPTQVKLTRTLPLYSEEPTPVESGAEVLIESSEGLQYVLAETSSGIYEHEDIPVVLSEKYRLHIRLSGGSEYFSDFVEVKITPPIDSVYWVPQATGVTIYVDTHDPANNTRYYKWEYIETFEYNSAYNSTLLFVDRQVTLRPLSDRIYICWRSDPAREILLGSSAKLIHDVISRYPITFLEVASIKMSRKYSVLVRQTALTESGYTYWQQLEQTTEKLGGLFDPLPAEVRGNLYNATDPSVPAVGFFSAGTIEETRMYFSHVDLPDQLKKTRPNFCVADSIPLDLLETYPDYTLLIEAYGVPFVEGYFTSSPQCIDCRLQGGTNTKPDFWE